MILTLMITISLIIIVLLAHSLVRVVKAARTLYLLHKECNRNYERFIKSIEHRACNPYASDEERTQAIAILVENAVAQAQRKQAREQ